MTLARLASFALPALLLVTSPGVPRAQGHARSAPWLGRVRVISLGQREPFELAAPPGGDVRIGTRDEILGIGLDDELTHTRLRDLAALGYPSLSLPYAMTSDGTRVAGRGFSENALYFEALWWDTATPESAHGLGGQISEAFAIQNTPSGLVVAGSRDSKPFDVRAGTLGILTGPGGASIDGNVTGISADGRVYCGHRFVGLARTALRWVDRVAEELDHPGPVYTEAYGVSDDGLSFCGDQGSYPALWLDQDGLALRPLLDEDGLPFQGRARGVLDDGFAFGEGRRGGVTFGWVWHPSYGGNEVQRFDTWLARWSSQAIHVESVRDVRATADAFHFSLYGGPFDDSWYVRTPRQP